MQREFVKKENPASASKLGQVGNGSERADPSMNFSRVEYRGGYK